MDRQRFDRIRTLFLEASRLPEEERTAFLSRECVGDEALLKGVQSLLDQKTEPPTLMRTGGLRDILDRPSLAGMTQGSQADLPDRIGPYKILEVLGEGGMGTVYRAEQTEPIRREVAIKLVRRDLTSPRAVARLESERQTLALMEHPNIARVLDAGADEHGSPYFVMEIVRGVPINQFCAERRLSVKERLHLFRTACGAVQHAHQQGIIHRDLKPSNVLVMLQNDVPVPKIIDFGIAKAVEESQRRDTLVTQEGLLIGTLDYMSPEAVRGSAGKVDTRSDVYALGVILYRLLTNAFPHDLKDLSLIDALRVVVEQRPKPPSTLQPHGRSLDDDLDTIVMKALEKEPENRYQSVAALGEDIDRFLGSQPLLSRPPSTVYQIRKLVQRHKTAFALLSTLFVFVVAVAITMSVLYENQRRARARAQAQTQKAETINEFLQEMLASADPAETGGEVTVRKLLDGAATRVETGLSGESDVQAAVRRTIGKTYMALGLFDEAESHLESALDEQVAIWGEKHPDVAKTLNDYGTLLRKRGEFESAEAHLREALEINRETLDEDDPQVAITMNNLANVFQDQNRFDEAEPFVRNSIAIDEDRFGKESEQVAAGMNNLGHLLWSQGNYAEAESLFTESIALLMKVHPDNHPDVADGLQNLSTVHRVRGNLAAADSLVREALAIYEALYGPEHPSVAAALNNLAGVLQAEKRYEDAEQYMRDYLAMVERIYGEENPKLAQAHNNLGFILKLEGKPAEAETHFRRTLAIREARGETEHPAVASTMGNLASVLHAQGRSTEAEESYVRALRMRERIYGPDHLNVSSSLISLGQLRLGLGDAARAESPLERALSIRKATLPAGHDRLTSAQRLLGKCWTELGHYEQAESLLVASYAAILAADPDSPSARRNVLRSLVELYDSWGRPKIGHDYRAELEDIGK